MKLKEEYWLYITIILLVIISLFMIRPYLSALLFAAAIAYILYPLHLRLKKKIRESFSAFSIVSIIFGIMILFMAYGINFIYFKLSNLSSILSSTSTISKLEFIGTSNILNEIISKLSNYIFSMTSKLPQYLISLFIFYVALYYFLIHGPEIYAYIKKILPIPEAKKKQLLEDIKSQVNAVVYVQLVIGIAQGILGGIGLFLFKFSYPLLGGIAMGILGFIPVIGPPILYVPIAIIAILKGNYFAGIGFLLFGIFVISTIDNLIRPFLMGKKAKIHPLVVIVGVFGGVFLFGAAGILIGPIILSITLTLLKDLRDLKIIE